MGRFPWRTTVSRLETAAAGLAPTTRADRHRALRRIGQVFEALKAEGKVSTMNPEKMRETDVSAFLAWIADNLDSSTAAKYVRFLGEVLAFAGNGVMSVMRARHVARFPKPARKPIRAVSWKTILALLEACDRISIEWWGHVGKAVTALLACSGLRPTEARMARFKDLDTVRWTIRVAVPKGLGRYATADQESPVMPDARPVLLDYLDIRAASLRKLGRDPETVEALFSFWNRCSTRNPIVGYWRPSSWRDLKQAIEKESGITFRWKDLRPTFAQEAKNRGAPIEAVSRALRHSSTAVTEAWYARIRAEDAFDALQEAWTTPAAARPIPR